MRRFAVIGFGALIAFLWGLGLAAAGQGSSNETKARADARRQLAALVLPAGASKVSADPSKGSVLARPPIVQATSPKYWIDDAQYWRVPGDPSQVAAWMQSQTPAGADGSFGASSSSSRVYDFGWFFPYSSEVVLNALDVEVAAARGGGSAVRADGVAAWVRAHPQWDQVPSTARVMTVWRTRQGRHSGPITFRHPSDLNRVADFLNQAPVAPPEVEHCPKGYDESFTVVFQARRSGPRLALSKVDENACGFVSLSVGGRHGPPLVGAYQLGRILSAEIRNKQKP